MRTLDEQMQRIDALDTKAGVLIAAGGVLAGLLFGRGALLGSADPLLAILTVLLQLISLVLALGAFASRRYEPGLRPETVVRLMAADSLWLRWRFLGNLVEAIEVNRGKLRWKARALTLSLACLICAVVLMGGYFMYLLLIGEGK